MLCDIVLLNLLTFAFGAAFLSCLPGVEVCWFKSKFSKNRPWVDVSVLAVLMFYPCCGCNMNKLGAVGEIRRPFFFAWCLKETRLTRICGIF